MPGLFENYPKRRLRRRFASPLPDPATGKERRVDAYGNILPEVSGRTQIPTRPSIVNRGTDVVGKTTIPQRRLAGGAGGTMLPSHQTEWGPPDVMLPSHRINAPVPAAAPAPPPTLGTSAVSPALQERSKIAASSFTAPARTRTAQPSFALSGKGVGEEPIQIIRGTNVTWMNPKNEQEYMTQEEALKGFTSTEGQALGQRAHEVRLEGIKGRSLEERARIAAGAQVEAAELGTQKPWAPIPIQPGFESLGGLATPGPGGRPVFYSTSEMGGGMANEAQEAIQRMKAMNKEQQDALFDSLSIEAQKEFLAILEKLKGKK